MSTSEPTLNRVTAFSVSDNTDHSEGRGREFVRAYTELESTAIRLAKGTYVQGTNAPVTQVFLYKCGDYYFPVGSEVTVLSPNEKDIEAEKRMRTYLGVVEKAFDLGLTAEDIEILKNGKEIMK